MKARLLTLAAGLMAGLTSAADPATTAKSAGLAVAVDNHSPALWNELAEKYAASQSGGRVTPSVGSWSKQREAVLKKELEPDVVSLGVGTDVDPLRKAGLIADDWSYRLPHRAVPYGSFTVFVVPKGNPRGIKDWADLARPDVRVLVNNPKGSRTGRHAVLAAYGSVTQRGGSDAEARAFLAAVFGRAKLPQAVAEVPVAAGAPATQAEKFLPQSADEVLLNWEKESLDAVRESGGRLEVVYPSVSIRGEAAVAVVGPAADKHGSREAAVGFGRFLFTDEAQEVIARHGFRPARPAALRKVRPNAPEVELFDARDLFPDVAAGHERFFGPGGVFEQVRPAAK